jgi:hypothetical protein
VPWKLLKKAEGCVPCPQAGSKMPHTTSLMDMDSFVHGVSTNDAFQIKFIQKMKYEKNASMGSV